MLALAVACLVFAMGLRLQDSFVATFNGQRSLWLVLRRSVWINRICGQSVWLGRWWVSRHRVHLGRSRSLCRRLLRLGTSQGRRGHVNVWRSIWNGSRRCGIPIDNALVTTGGIGLIARTGWIRERPRLGHSLGHLLGSLGIHLFNGLCRLTVSGLGGGFVGKAITYTDRLGWLTHPLQDHRHLGADWLNRGWSSDKVSSEPVRSTKGIRMFGRNKM